MKMTIAAIAIALVYLVSFVAANQLNEMGVTMTSDQAMTSDINPKQATPSADQTIPMITTMRGQGTPSHVAVGVVSNKVDAKGNNILITKSNILISKSDRVKLAHTIKEMLSNSPEAGPVSSMSTDDLFALLTRIATNSAMLSHAAGVISAVKSGDRGALADHVVGLLSAAVPAAILAPSAVGSWHSCSGRCSGCCSCCRFISSRYCCPRCLTDDAARSFCYVGLNANPLPLAVHAVD